jgi:hypothetical protein
VFLIQEKLAEAKAPEEKIDLGNSGIKLPPTLVGRRRI